MMAANNSMTGTRMFMYVTGIRFGAFQTFEGIVPYGNTCAMIPFTTFIGMANEMLLALL